MLPAFVFRWLKESSATGYLRFGGNVNKRVQDGTKRYWLCYDCEQLFCGWETQFANKVFYPLIADGGQKIQYGDWMLKFCVSVSWRVLSTLIEDTSLTTFSNAQVNMAHSALKAWSHFLLGSDPNLGVYEQHFLPMGLCDDFTWKHAPTNLNRYLLRSVDATPVASNAGAIVYSKLERFIVIGFIDINSPEQWVGTKVHRHSGTVGKGDFVLPKEFGDFLLGRCKMGLEVQEAMDDKQKKKIAKFLRTNMDRLRLSDTMQALRQDIRTFGKEEVFKAIAVCISS